MLMNGKEVNHLIIAGEAFDRSCSGKKVQVINTIYLDSGITWDGKYYYTNTGGMYLPGREGIILLIKYLNYYYVAGTIGPDKFAKGAWCRAEDIKILD